MCGAIDLAKAYSEKGFYKAHLPGKAEQGRAMQSRRQGICLGPSFRRPSSFQRCCCAWANMEALLYPVQPNLPRPPMSTWWGPLNHSIGVRTQYR
eukprot:s529_g27.t1